MSSPIPRTSEFIPRSVAAVPGRFKALLPREHGGWFLFLVPLTVGLGVAGRFDGQAAAFVMAALALFLARQPLDLTFRSWRNRRMRADLRLALIWLAVCVLLIALASAYLLFVARLWGVLLLGVVGTGLLALQLWASSARLARTMWAEVIGTTGLALAAAGTYHAASGVWSATALVLWILMAVIGVGGVLYARWRLRRRRLALRANGEEVPPAAPRVSVLSHYAGGMVLVLLLALAGLTPWAVTPLYVILLARVVWGTRLAAKPDRTVLAIGLGEGIATILSGAWIVAAYRLW